MKERGQTDAQQRPLAQRAREVSRRFAHGRKARNEPIGGYRIGETEVVLDAPVVEDRPIPLPLSLPGGIELPPSPETKVGRPHEVQRLMFGRRRQGRGRNSIRLTRGIMPQGAWMLDQRRENRRRTCRFPGPEPVGDQPVLGMGSITAASCQRHTNHVKGAKREPRVQANMLRQQLAFALVRDGSQPPSEPCSSTRRHFPAGDATPSATNRVGKNEHRLDLHDIPLDDSRMIADPYGAVADRHPFVCLGLVRMPSPLRPRQPAQTPPAAHAARPSGPATKEFAA